MPDRIRVACVQLTTRQDKAANLERAERLVARAAAGGARLVVLPEKWTGFGSPEILREAAESLDGGEAVAAMAGGRASTGSSSSAARSPSATATAA